MMVDDRILGRQHFNADSVAIAVGYWCTLETAYKPMLQMFRPRLQAVVQMAAGCTQLPYS